jgi:hypothetical protein
MTVLVGLLCKDGVVIGADSSATFGPHQSRPTIEQSCQKVFVVQNRFIIAGTGQVGAGQRFTAAVESAWTKNEFKNLNIPTDYGKIFSMIGIKDFASTEMQKGCFGGLVAFPTKREANLCELAVADFQPELKTAKMWFASMGSGQPITDPFLGMLRRVFYPNGGQPTVKEGLFLATWALEHAIELNPGGINGPPQLARLTLNGKGEPDAHLCSEDELAEHKDSAKAAEKHLAGFKAILNGEKATEIEIPNPLPQQS